jgi:hypothetical protein
MNAVAGGATLPALLGPTRDQRPLVQPTLPCSLILWAIGYRSRRSIDGPQCVGAQVFRIALAFGCSLENTFRNEGTRALRSAPGGKPGACFVKASFMIVTISRS